MFLAFAVHGHQPQRFVSIIKYWLKRLFSFVAVCRNLLWLFCFQNYQKPYQVVQRYKVRANTLSLLLDRKSVV